MKISVIIPCFNESRTIGMLLRKVIDVKLDMEVEIIVIDDGSTDGTRDYLKSLENKESNLKIIFHEKNKGKGAALRSGFKASSGEIIIIQDADLEYNPNEYKKLLAPIIEGKADVVYGSRFATGESHRVLYFWHAIGNKLLTFFCNCFSTLNLTDIEVCYKVFKREVLNKIELKENGFGFEPEFTIKMARSGSKVYEVGISYAGRTYAEGKKITWKDGLITIFVILRYGLFG